MRDSERREKDKRERAWGPGGRGIKLDKRSHCNAMPLVESIFAGRRQAEHCRTVWMKALLTTLYRLLEQVCEPYTAHKDHSQYRERDVRRLPVRAMVKA